MSDLLYFDGVVVVANSRLTGTILSDDLINSFRKSWVPPYQRERVPSTKKINSLIDIFRNNKPIEAITLGLQGTYDFDKKSGDGILEGDINAIDGQQRLFALQDSKATGIKVKVEIYLNLPRDEEISLFHQLNKDGTALTFGDLAKSTPGSYGDVVRWLLKSKNQLTLPTSVNAGKGGVHLALLAPLLYLIQRKFKHKLLRPSFPT